MIEAIFVARQKASAQQAAQEIALVAGKGIVGDRNFGRHRWPGQNITFVEAEEVEAFNLRHARSISADDTRRNIVTRGVRLNDVVGRRFRIGPALFHGVELCEPCKTLGTLLAASGMPPHEVVRAWVHKAGLRADVLSSGVIRAGMPFSLDIEAATLD